MSCISTPKSTVIAISISEQSNIHIKSMLDSFDSTICSKLCNPRKCLTTHNLTLDTMHKYIDNFISNLLPRKISTMYSKPDMWEGDINSLPFEPTSEESIIEKFDVYIGVQIPLHSKNRPVLVRQGDDSINSIYIE